VLVALLVSYAPVVFDDQRRADGELVAHRRRRFGPASRADAVLR
jgi:hypothetical protein